jgi:hypothetical protein
VEAAPAWRDAEKVPAAVVDYAASVGIKPPTPDQWSGLTLLERFALLKLTRDSHDNINFKPGRFQRVKARDDATAVMLSWT